MPQNDFPMLREEKAAADRKSPLQGIQQSGGNWDDLHAPFYDCFCGFTNFSGKYIEFGDGDL